MSVRERVEDLSSQSVPEVRILPCETSNLIFECYLFTAFFLCTVLVPAGCNTVPVQDSEGESSESEFFKVFTLQQVYNKVEDEEEILSGMLGEEREAPARYVIYGYHVLDGAYFNHRDVKRTNPILDYEKIKNSENIHLEIDKTMANRTESKVYYGNTAKELLQSINVEANAAYILAEI